MSFGPSQRRIRNKAARGELRRGLPVGLVWGEADGEVRFHPDEAVRTTIARIFSRFAETAQLGAFGYVPIRGLRIPLRMHRGGRSFGSTPATTRSIRF